MKLLSRLFALTLALILIAGAALPAFAAGVTYKYSVELEMGVDDDTGEPRWKASGILRVTGTGETEDYPGIVGKNTERLKYAVIGEGITKLGRSFFGECSNLQHVSLPSTLTTIEKSGFNFCTKLESLTLPESLTQIDNYVFYYCNSLQKLRVPDSVTRIGEDAFYRCSSLTLVYVPATVKDIAFNAFNQCERLTILTPAGSTAEKYAKSNEIAVKTYTSDMDLDELFPVDEFEAPEGNEKLRESDLTRANDKLTGYGEENQLPAETAEKAPEQGGDKKTEKAEESSFPVIPVAVGGGAAAVVIIVIAVILAARGKKKKAAGQKKEEAPTEDKPDDKTE